MQNIVMYLLCIPVCVAALFVPRVGEFNQDDRFAVVTPWSNIAGLLLWAGLLCGALRGLLVSRVLKYHGGAVVNQLLRVISPRNRKSRPPDRPSVNIEKARPEAWTTFHRYPVYSS